MPKYDVTDEAIIDASPEVVYNAVIDEMDGKTDWWMPYHETKLREGDSYGTVGALHDATVLIRGKLSIKFTAKTVEVVPNEMIRIDYVEGSLLGEGIWRFEGLDGKTKLSFQWRVSPSGFLRRMFAPFLPYKHSHSKVTKIGFGKLNEFLDGGGMGK